MTSCKLIFYGFYIYFPLLSDLWCFAYVFDSFENITKFWIAFKNIFSGSSTHGVGCERESVTVLQEVRLDYCLSH